MARKSGLTLREEIILHLHALGRFEMDIEGPYAATREGIASALGIKPSQLSRDIRPLITAGEVEWRVVHVLGFRKRVRTYRLSEKGMKRALHIMERIRDVTVTWMDEFGNVETSTLEKAVKRTGGRHGYLDLLRMRDTVAGGGVVVTSPAPPILPERFIGRGEELTFISRWFGDRSSNILVVYGIAGVGKTSLVMRFASTLRDVARFHIRLHEWDSVRGVLELLGNALAGTGDERLQSYLRNRPYEDLSNVSIILHDVLSSRGALLVLDDVWSASTGMRRLLSMLCEVVIGAGGKMILVSREFPAWLDGSARARGQITEMRVEGLTKDDAKELLEWRGVSTPSDRHVAEIIDALKGHPLLLTMLQGTEDVQAVYEGDITMFMYGEIFSRLSPGERRILNVLAVLRYPVPAASIVGRFGYGSLEDLFRKALIERGRDVVSIHDLIRSFVLASMALEERRACHITARGMLPRTHVLERAYHAVSAGMGEDAVREVTSKRDDLIASGHARDVLDLLESVPQNDLSLRAMRDLVAGVTTCLSHMGEFKRAIDYYENAPKQVRRDPETMLIAAGNYTLDGDFRRARETLAALKRSVSGDDISLKVARAMGRLLVSQGRYDQAERRFTRALAIARRSGSKGMVAETLMDLGTIAIYREESREATRYLLEAMRLLRGGNEYALGRVYLNLSIAYYHRSMHDLALSMLERALTIYKRSGDYVSVLKLMINRSAIFYETGRIREARGVLLDVLELARRSGARRFTAAALVNLSMTYNMQGDHVEAGSLAREALRIAEDIGDIRITASVKNSLALSALGEKKVEDAISLARESLELSERIGTHGMRIDALETLAESHLARGDAQTALSHAGRALEIARQKGVLHSMKRIERLVRRIRRMG